MPMMNNHKIARYNSPALNPKPGFSSSMLKHDSKVIPEWTNGKNYGKYFPKDFFFAKEDVDAPFKSESRNGNEYYNRPIPPISSKYKRSLITSSSVEDSLN
eukprot:CAMPEP_0205823786 /NCGR_PEP_ID=MMETSP0206-20130828/17878_1 /ASSEMBLY_ACC=CAM_ASM_000279 /TAXON_ID=36767 /ORGANISM="Euplotes focardii, Strain TN1" /LENGTH=100 /DNA_ID=CAMNT_0053121261 /DNA_START=20 /DNA_END=322 /DNA_ORIENTATION=+